MTPIAVDAPPKAVARSGQVAGCTDSHRAANVVRGSSWPPNAITTSAQRQTSLGRSIPIEFEAIMTTGPPGRLAQPAT